MDTGSRKFRFGVTGFGRTRAEWQDFARKAEDLGFSTLVIPDHFGPQFSPLPALMAAAYVTSRLHVGTLVYDNDFRHPAIVAKDAATADVMTDGRFELGLGAGWMPADYQQTGIPFEPARVRVERLEESLQIVKSFLAGEVVNFQGKHYQVRELQGAPKPVQQPRLPIMVGASGPRMLGLVGRHADIASIQAKPVPGRSPLLLALTGSDFEKQRAIVREHAGPRYAQMEISVLANAQVNDNQAETLERLATQMETTEEEVLGMPAMYVGSTEAVVEQLLERRERHDISYPVIFGASIDSFAPVVAKLAGK